MTTLVYSLTISTLLLAIVVVAAAALRKKNAADGMFFACWLTALALFICNGWMAHALPFGNMRHVLCFFPLVLPPAAWYMRRCRRIDLIPYFAAVAAVSMVGALCMPMQAAWRQMPALQSPWFAPHVTAYVVSYGFLAVAAVLTVAACFGKHRHARLHAADEVVVLAFPFLTFGLWSGAIWADAAWARYWAWDIKEAWALITWCIYLLYFHVRRFPAFAGWRRPLLLLGFVAVLITFFVVNLLPTIQSVHSYAQ